MLMQMPDRINPELLPSARLPTRVAMRMRTI